MKDRTAFGAALSLDVNERTAVFIEGPKFFIACRYLGFSPDLPIMRGLFSRSSSLVDLRFYRAILEDGQERPAALAGYNVIDKMGRVVTDSFGRKKDLGADLSLQMTADIIDLSHTAPLDRIVLMSSNEDMEQALRMVGARDIKTTVVASATVVTSEAHPLWRAADTFVALGDLKAAISAPPVAPRPSFLGFSLRSA